MRGTIEAVDIERLGKDIKRLRETVGLSQEGLAGKAKVARGIIQELEKGRGNPTIDTIGSIEKALGRRLIQHFGEGVNLGELTDFRESLLDMSIAKRAPPPLVLKSLAEHPQKGDSLSVANLLVARFLDVPVRVRALVLYLLFGDKEGALRPYLKDLADLLPKPK